MSRAATAIERVTGPQRPALVMNRHGFLTGEMLSGPAKEIGAAAIDQQVSKYSALVDQLMASLRTVANDRDLNPLGKANKRQALRDEVAKLMAEVEQNQVRHFATALKTAQEAVDALPAPKPPKDIVEFHYQKEIRDDLKTMQQLDREAAVMSAVAEGHSELVRAVVHSPTKIVSESVKVKILDTWKRATNPVAFERLEAAQESHQTFVANRNMASRMLGKLIGGDPLQDAAGPSPEPVEAGV